MELTGHSNPGQEHRLLFVSIRQPLGSESKHANYQWYRQSYLVGEQNWEGLLDRQANTRIFLEKKRFNSVYSYQLIGNQLVRDEVYSTSMLSRRDKKVAGMSLDEFRKR